MEIYTIYDHPKDFPDAYVARCWRIRSSGPVAGEVVHSADLEELRGQMRERGLVRLPREFSDDPVIIESWI